MVVRWKNKDGTGGVVTNPLTPAERRYLKNLDNADHGGPVVTVGPGPGPRNAALGVAATNRRTEATSRSAADAVPDPIG